MCNCEIFQITGWDAIWACCREMGSPVCASCSMPDQSCKNTVTVYASGIVIIRLSWNKSVLWTDRIYLQQTIDASSAICRLVEACC